jgi:hypothetical protein
MLLYSENGEKLIIVEDGNTRDSHHTTPTKGTTDHQQGICFITSDRISLQSHELTIYKL